MNIQRLLLMGLLCCCAPTAIAQSVRLPDSCLVDFRDTLERPAGRRGFLRVGSSGHFVWNDGTRARFWGINVSSTRLDIPDEQIEKTTEAFARAGLNLVRLEAVDNRNCLLGSVDAPTSRKLDIRYLDRLDRWMDALRRHGIYYYLDLLDFRTFKAGDGVLNAPLLDRGARPYAVFDPYLIQLQKEFATAFLTHQNPYSGLRPVDDPALAMVEICNEHGFFLYPDKLETLAEPYRTNLRERWNLWLEQKYGRREALEQAWGRYNDWKTLRPEENLENRSVALPTLMRQLPADSRASTAPNTRLAPARLRDGVAFLSDVQRDYFRQMRGHLLSIGLHIPVTAVVSNNVPPDVASVAQECDFTSENWYGDGPNEDARVPKTRFYANRNPLRDESAGGFAPFTAALRWNNRPVVIREWAVSWPNRSRAASVPEALAYASLQDFDAMLLFGYQTNRAPNGSLPDALNDYAFQSDPTVWGLTALAGQAFLHGEIQPARQIVTLRYPKSRRFEWPVGLSDLHRLAYITRLQSVTEGVAIAEPKNALTADTTTTDLQAIKRLLTRWKGGGIPMSWAAWLLGVWRSDTGQVVRYTREGRLEVRTPTLRILAGEFTPGRVYDLARGLKFSTQTPFGALFLYALDGKPVEISGHLVCKMVSRAENTGETFIKAPLDGVGDWALTNPGAAPILTFGRTVTQPTRLWMETPGKPGQPAPSPRVLLSLWMADGTWELRLRNGTATLACDTPGMSGLALGRTFTTTGKPTEVAQYPEATSILTALGK